MFIANFGDAHHSDSLQWSYEEVEVRDISLTYVYAPANPSAPAPNGRR
jgi:hypothetical protein